VIGNLGVRIKAGNRRSQKIWEERTALVSALSACDYNFVSENQGWEVEVTERRVKREKNEEGKLAPLRLARGGTKCVFGLQTWT